ACLAGPRGRRDQARDFLREAFAGPLSAEQRGVAEVLLRDLSDPEVSEQVRPVVAPAPEPVESLPAAVPVRHRRSLTELLAAFMEEKNILWGELVGGLLIVGGSIALVISLWHTLQENPYFPFGIFAAVTMALFGAGLYTLHHWKLESSSRGLLVIAGLLVPLNFLVLPSMLH